jgi:3-mercaptopyruvate sulfurtransferase SseA
VRIRMIRTVAWAAIAVGVFALCAAAQETDLSKAPRITLAEFKKLFDAHDVVVVDVRDEASFRAGHIPGALSIPLDQLAAKTDQLKAEKKPIVTYCA